MNEITLQAPLDAEAMSALRAQVLEYKALNGFVWKSLANRMGVSASTISLWASGKYSQDPLDGPNQKVAAKVTRFFASDESQRQLDDEAAVRPGFQLTESARQMQGIARWSQRGNMTVLVGDPGIGKTEALGDYARKTPNVWMAAFSPTSKSMSGMLLRVLRAMGADRRGGGRFDLSLLVRERVEGRRGLIISDESQHLDAPALEELRAIHDETGVGLLLAGNREVLTRVEGVARGAAFAQLHSRVSMRHVFDRPRAADVELILEAWRVEDPKERELLTGIAMRPGGGAIRALTHTLELATLVAQQNRARRSIEHLQGAWAQLSSRPVAA